jgi:hypothetical protein
MKNSVVFPTLSHFEGVDEVRLASSMAAEVLNVPAKKFTAPLIKTAFRRRQKRAK